MEQTLKDMEVQLNENEYTQRFITYDIAQACYYGTLCLPEKIPDWLKDKFAPYGHVSFIENLGNQAKARYCYLTNNYPPLLAYIEEQKKRESVLYGRTEMMAMEACIYYRMKDKEKACAVLAEAYNNASPNDIIIPFIELGKDMRMLTSFALKQPNNAIPQDWAIPREWLESVNRKSATYAKRQVHVAAEYKRANNIKDDIAISPREHDILTDLSHGLSRAEIAASRRLSINTVKMVINNVFMKLGAENLADAIRIATERKIV
jgi:DNA-binding NarL/FixJ family response regulator